MRAQDPRVWVLYGSLRTRMADMSRTATSSNPGICVLVAANDMFFEFALPP